MAVDVAALVQGAGEAFDVGQRVPLGGSGSASGDAAEGQDLVVQQEGQVFVSPVVSL